MWLKGVKGNCHELRMHLSKFICGNMAGFLSTFRSRNLLCCLELFLSPPKARHMWRFCLASMQPWIKLEKFSFVFFKLNCSWQFPFKCRKLSTILPRVVFNLFNGNEFHIRFYMFCSQGCFVIPKSYFQFCGCWSNLLQRTFIARVTRCQDRWRSLTCSLYVARN